MSERGELLQHLVGAGEGGAAVDDPLAAARRGDGQVDGTRLGTGRGGGCVGHQVLVLGVVAAADDEDDGVLEDFNRQVNIHTRILSINAILSHLKCILRPRDVVHVATQDFGVEVGVVVVVLALPNLHIILI